MRRLISFVGSFFALSALALPVSTAWAHPGHGSTDPTTVLHLAEPMHLLAWLAPLAIVALVAAKLARRDS